MNRLCGSQTRVKKMFIFLVLRLSKQPYIAISELLTVSTACFVQVIRKVFKTVLPFADDLQQLRTLSHVGKVAVVVSHHRKRCLFFSAANQLTLITPFLKNKHIAYMFYTSNKKHLQICFFRVVEISR